MSGQKGTGTGTGTGSTTRHGYLLLIIGSRTILTSPCTPTAGRRDLMLHVNSPVDGASGSFEEAPCACACVCTCAVDCPDLTQLAIHSEL